MNKDSDIGLGHPTDMLLAFLDNTLDPEQTDRIRSHLEKCRECSKELESLKNITGTLTSQNGVFCPESWELFEFAQTDMDPGEKIQDHLQICELCEQEVQNFRNANANDPISAKTWKKIENALPKAQTKNSQSKNSLWDRINLSFSFFKFPALATVAAAALLCAVLLYPGGQPDFILGLSSETWDKPAPTLKLMAPGSDGQLIQKSLPFKSDGGAPAEPEGAEPKTEPAPVPADAGEARPKVAFLILLEGKSLKFTPAEINSFYRSLQPSEAMKKKFEFVSPKIISEYANRNEISMKNRNDLIESLKKRLNVDQALLISLSEKKSGFEINSDLVDARTGKLLKQISESGVPPEKLPSRLVALSRL